MPNRCSFWTVGASAQRVAWWVVLAGMAAVLTAQTETPVIRSTTHLVEVNVIVRNKARSVQDLRKEDFTLLDRGKPQRIAFFSVNSAEEAARMATSRPEKVFTNRAAGQGGDSASATVVLLDGVNTQIADQIYAKKQFLAFLSQIEPRDRIAVYALGRQLRVLNDFTNDARRLSAAVSRHSGELGSVGDGGAPDDFDPTESKEDRLWNEFLRKEDERSVEARVNLTVEAMEAIASRVGRIRGRKNLIWVSASFPFAIGVSPHGVAPGARLFAREINRAARALNDANIAVYPVDARGLVGVPALRADNGRAPRNGLEFFTPPGQDTMQMMADATGGRVFMNDNAIRHAIRSVLDDSRLTYTLAFYPDPNALDSTFHQIKVKVNRPGVEVRARGGYLATREMPPTDLSREGLIRSAIASPVEATGIAITTAARSIRERQPESVEFTITMAAGDLALDQQQASWKAVVDVVVAQRAADGRTVRSTTLVLRPSLDENQYAAAIRRGLGFVRTIELATDAVEARIVVFDRGSGRIGSVLVPLR